MKSVAIVSKSKANVGSVGVGYVRSASSWSLKASFQTASAFVLPKKGAELVPSVLKLKVFNPIGVAPLVSLKTFVPFNHKL